MGMVPLQILSRWTLASWSNEIAQQKKTPKTRVQLEMIQDCMGGVTGRVLGFQIFSTANMGAGNFGSYKFVLLIHTNG